MSESVILCEGYHDRAFWMGWLLRLGCTDPGTPPAGRTNRVPIADPWGMTVTGGQFAYHSQSGRFVRVVPCHGKSRVIPAARIRLGQRNTRALTRLVLNVDSDLTTSSSTASSSGLKATDVLREVRAFDSSAALNADGEIEVDGGATLVSLVRWEATDPPTAGLPDQQTLERLVCAALAAAYPPRAAWVQSWLDGRPHCPAVDPKEHAWSYMAGWFAESGCEAFFSKMWTDPQVVSELENRLKASGAWRIAETLAG